MWLRPWMNLERDKVSSRCGESVRTNSASLLSTGLVTGMTLASDKTAWEAWEFSKSDSQNVFLSFEWKWYKFPTYQTPGLNGVQKYRAKQSINYMQFTILALSLSVFPAISINNSNFQRWFLPQCKVTDYIMQCLKIGLCLKFNCTSVYLDKPDIYLEEHFWIQVSPLCLLVIMLVW